MTFPKGRGRLSGTWGSNNKQKREGRESLLLNPEPTSTSGFSNKYDHHHHRRRYNHPQEGKSASGSNYNTSSSGGSISSSSAGGGGGGASQTFEIAANNSRRLSPQNRFQPQHGTVPHSRGSSEISPDDGVLQFVPAFDESAAGATPSFGNSNMMPDASWDAILNEGSTSFPNQGRRITTAKSEAIGFSSNNRFKRKTQSSPRAAMPSEQLTSGGGIMPRRPSDAESSISTSRSKGQRIARLASLFSSSAGGGSSSTSKPSTTATNTSTSTTHNSRNFEPHNTTDATLPSSPSRSSSSGGYVGWPGTQNKQGQTVAIQSSYEEESECRSNNLNSSDPPSQQSFPFGDELEFEKNKERQRREVQELMNSPPFQDISGVMSDPDISGMTMPEPPGEKADDSFYFVEAEQQRQQQLRQQPHQQLQRQQQHSSALHMEQLFHNTNQPGWDDVHAEAHSSPSRSSFSKNSSAYFADNDVRAMAFPAAFADEEGERRRRQRAAAAGVMRRGGPQPPTEASLALNNSLSPLPPRTFHPEASRGYRGLIDKTHDVPNLMDAMDSDSMASSSGRGSSSNVPSSATGSGPPGAYNGTRPTITPTRLMPRVREEDFMMSTRDSESDVFDEISKYSINDSEPFEGILSTSDSKQSNPFEGFNISQSVVEDSKASLHELRTTTSSVEKRYNSTNSKNPTEPSADSNNKVKVVLLGGGLTTIQTTNADFSNRISASDFDECLTNSDIDEYGHTRLPSFKEMAAAGRSPYDNASVVDISGTSADHLSLNSRDNRTNQSFGSFEAPGPHADFIQVRGKEFTAFETENHPHSRRSINTSSDHGYKDDESAFFSDFYSADEVGFDGDLSEYYVQPSQVKRLVRKYRKMCRATLSKCQTYDELDRAEDEKKVFALFEMRSRIMEKDIERGLERRGGTSVVDDLVTTPTNLRAMRIRDAVIVSKAWRDGATPLDVINTARLTQRDHRSFFIKRLNPVSGSRDVQMPRYRWEEVAWIDDTDFMQYCCPSLGSRHLRGTEVYTIGDCQSILLKLTNEACIELRGELNDATARQIEAEELMKEEADYGDGMMTESEMTYLTAMEEVKTISRQLVIAEKAFALVRDRIRNLVAKYESLLVKIDNEDMATSSVITADSSCYSEDYDSRVSTDFDEELAWHRRQKRAEVSAELAAREALLAKQSEARAVQEEKHRELRELQTRLAELQSEPSTTVTDRQRSVVLAKAIAARKQQQQQHQSSSVLRTEQHHQDDHNPQQSQDSKVEGVKQRFRDRMAARMRQQQNLKTAAGAAAGAADNSNLGQGSIHHQSIQHQHPGSRYFMQQEPPKPTTLKSPALMERQKLIRLAGQECFQHLDFYERSLKAVETAREGAL